MSLCDRCFAPGQCCRDLVLLREDGHTITTWVGGDPVAELADRIGEHWFVPASVQGEWTVPEDAEEDAGRTYRAHRWACRALGPDGRCTVYESRPALCRAFEPGSGPLCVHYQGAEGGEG